MPLSEPDTVPAIGASERDHSCLMSVRHQDGQRRQELPSTTKLQLAAAMLTAKCEMNTRACYHSLHALTVQLSTLQSHQRVQGLGGSSSAAEYIIDEGFAHRIRRCASGIIP